MRRCRLDHVYNVLRKTYRVYLSHLHAKSKIPFNLSRLYDRAGWRRFVFHQGYNG